MDALNAAIVYAYTHDAAYMAAAPGGMWHLKSDEGTPLPLSKFQVVIADAEYTFGSGNNVSSERYVYKFTAYAEDNDQNAGGALAAIVNGHLKRVINAAILIVPGYRVLSSSWTHIVPDNVAPAHSGKDEYSQGILVEIIIAPV